MRKKTKITIVKSKRDHTNRSSTTANEVADPFTAFDAVQDSFKMAATTCRASIAITRALMTIPFPPPADTVCGQRVKALAKVRHLTSELRRQRANLYWDLTVFDDCLNRFESAIAKEQAEVDALLAAGAEIDETEDED